MEDRAGRTWRPLADTAVSASLLYAVRDDEWSSWRRSADFYDEGTLLWLEVDVLIRERSQGARSLDNFCHTFLGARPEPGRVFIYSLDDVVAALSAVCPYDWRGYFRERVERTAPHPPLHGLEAGGWRLVYKGTPNPRAAAIQKVRRLVLGGQHPLGLVLRDDGSVLDVRPHSPAWRAGLGPGMKVLGVNGRRWSTAGFEEALATAAGSAGKIEILAENYDRYRLHRLDCRCAERYAHLERVKVKPDLLGAILTSSAKSR